MQGLGEPKESPNIIMQKDSNFSLGVGYELEILKPRLQQQLNGDTSRRVKRYYKHNKSCKQFVRVGNLTEQEISRNYVVK